MKVCKWKHIAIFILLLVSHFSFAQIKIENLETELENSTGIKRVEILIKLSEEYIHISPQKSLEYSKEASILINEYNYKQKILRIILIEGIIIILTLLILYFLSFRNKIKANKILQEQNEQIRAKNLEIKEKTEHLTKINKDLEKLSIAASKTDNAIIIFNPKGDIEWINEGYIRLYGYTLENLIIKKGKNFKDISSNEAIEKIFNTATAEKKSQVYETDVISDHNKKYKIYTTLTPILNKNDEIVRFIAIDSDVTKLKEVEERLKKLLITKDKFFSIIAHDLKNPFNSLIGLSQLLVHGFDRMSTEKVKYFHQNLYQISKNGYELLINLLEWSRSQMGRIQFNPEINNVHALVQETFTLYNSKAVQKEITLTNNTESSSQVYADKNMLKTILRNLVQNALKFTERGGAIEISEKKLSEQKEIIIRDTGIGIDPENIKKLFKLDEHYTTEGTEDELGTGLGLILCEEFMEKHTGSINLESKVGYGSQFILTFPDKK
ncbi:ATP-binding protein [Bacteroidota bacterium]